MRQSPAPTRSLPFYGCRIGAFKRRPSSGCAALDLHVTGGAHISVKSLSCCSATQLTLICGIGPGLKWIMWLLLPSLFHFSPPLFLLFAFTHSFYPSVVFFLFVLFFFPQTVEVVGSVWTHVHTLER